MLDSNFKLRVRSALMILLSLGLASLIVPLSLLLQVLMYATFATSAYEMWCLLRQLIQPLSFVERALFLLLLALNFTAAQFRLYPVCALFASIGALYAYQITGKNNRRNQTLTISFIPILITIMAMVCFYTWSHHQMLHEAFFYSPILIAILSDLSGYTVGKFLPSTKFGCAVSPGKTYEGFIAALLIPPLLYCLLLPFLPFLPSYSYGQLLVFSAAAIWGDLIFSLAKRLSGLKDYSALIPGHGGVLDRVDSWIGALFVLFIC